MVLITAFLIALASAFLGALGYLWQKNVDRAAQRKDIRREVYEDYIAACRHAEATALWHPDEAVTAAEDFSALQELLFLYAPQEVVKHSQELDTAFYAWRATLGKDNPDDTETAYDKVAALKAQIKLAMRHDLFADDAPDLLPFLKTALRSGGDKNGPG